MLGEAEKEPSTRDLPTLILPDMSHSALKRLSKIQSTNSIFMNMLNDPASAIVLAGDTFA